MKKLLSSALSLACLLTAACSVHHKNDPANTEENRNAPAFHIDLSNKTDKETPAQRKVRLRKKAETDPDAADAEAISHMSRNEVIATAINTAGFLCARVLSAYPVGGSINVECVEYRSGEGRVKYTIDPNSGTVEQE